MTAYKEDDVVWIKIARYPYWPGQVVEPDVSECDCPAVGKNIAHVKFFAEEACTIVKDESRIRPFKCDQMWKFINKGKDLEKSNRELRRLFDQALEEAQELTGLVLASAGNGDSSDAATAAAETRSPDDRKRKRVDPFDGLDLDLDLSEDADEPTDELPVDVEAPDASDSRGATPVTNSGKKRGRPRKSETSAAATAAPRSAQKPGRTPKQGRKSGEATKTPRSSSLRKGKKPGRPAKVVDTTTDSDEEFITPTVAPLVTKSSRPAPQVLSTDPQYRYNCDRCGFATNRQALIVGHALACLDQSTDTLHQKRRDTQQKFRRGIGGSPLSAPAAVAGASGGAGPTSTSYAGLDGAPKPRFAQFAVGITSRTGIFSRPSLFGAVTNDIRKRRFFGRSDESSSSAVDDEPKTDGNGDGDGDEERSAARPVGGSAAAAGAVAVGRDADDDDADSERQQAFEVSEEALSKNDEEEVEQQTASDDENESSAKRRRLSDSDPQESRPEPVGESSRPDSEPASAKSAHTSSAMQKEASPESASITDSASTKRARHDEPMEVDGERKVESTQAAPVTAEPPPVTAPGATATADDDGGGIDVDSEKRHSASPSSSSPSSDSASSSTSPSDEEDDGTTSADRQQQREPASDRTTAAVASSVAPTDANGIATPPDVLSDSQAETVAPPVSKPATVTETADDRHNSMATVNDAKPDKELVASSHGESVSSV